MNFMNGESPPGPLPWARYPKRSLLTPSGRFANPKKMGFHQWCRMMTSGMDLRYIYIYYIIILICDDILWLSWLNMTDILVSAVHTSCQPGVLWLPTPIRSTEHNKSRRFHSFPRSPKHTQYCFDLFCMWVLLWSVASFYGCLATATWKAI